MTTEIVDPFFEWSIREDGALAIYIHDDIGGEVAVRFENYEPFANLTKGVGDMEIALNIFEDDGYAAAAEFADEIAKPNELSTDDIDKLLGG